MLRRVVPYLAYAYMTFVGLTTRLRVRDLFHKTALRDRKQHFLYAFWHQRQVFFTYTHRGDGASVLVSRSKDGEMIAETMRLSDIAACRGSSSRGGAAAAREMMESVARGFDIGITPDGPKGPVRQVKPGVLFLALKLGIPILPLANALSRKVELANAWDRFQVPLPFGRASLVYGEPMWVKEGDDIEAKTLQLKTELDRITDLADFDVT